MGGAATAAAKEAMAADIQRQCMQQGQQCYHTLKVCWICQVHIVWCGLRVRAMLGRLTKWGEGEEGVDLRAGTSWESVMGWAA